MRVEIEHWPNDHLQATALAEILKTQLVTYFICDLSESKWTEVCAAIAGSLCLVYITVSYGKDGIEPFAKAL